MEEAPSRGRTNTLPEVPPTKPVAKEPGRRSKIKWPKANEWAEWQKPDSELTQRSELALQGGIESKLNMFSEIIYEKCKERLGEVRRKQPTALRKGRRVRDIKQLVREMRPLRRN